MPLEIFTDAYLTQLAEDAELDISRRLLPFFERFSITTVVDQAIYTLPAGVKDIIRVTWKGDALSPITIDGIVQGADQLLEKEGSPPIYYMRGFDNLASIRLLPAPQEVLTADDTSIYQDDITTLLVVTAKMDPTISATDFVLPDYLARRTVKHYVLWHAFLREGLGQNIDASRYHESRYNQMLEMYRDSEVNHAGAMYLLGRHQRKKKSYIDRVPELIVPLGARTIPLLAESGTPLTGEDGVEILLEI